MERLELGQHTITVTTPSSSYWKFDYFLVQTVTLQSPDFLYSSNYGNISSCPGSENGTLIPDPHSTAALQSVFVSYTLSDHTLVPKQTYTTSLPGTTSSAPSTGTGDLPNHPNLQKRVIIGAVLGSVTSAMLVILLLWRVCRRRNLRRANLLGTGRSVNYMDSAESMVMARPFYIRQLTTKVGMKLDGGKEKRGDRTSGTSSIPQPIPEKNRRQQQQSSGSSRAVSPPVGTNPPSAPRNIIEIEAPARIPVHESMGTRREPEPGLGPETPQEERRRRRQVIRESDAGISLDPAIDDNGNKESVEVLPPAYEHHRGSRQYTS